MVSHLTQIPALETRGGFHHSSHVGLCRTHRISGSFFQCNHGKERVYAALCLDNTESAGKEPTRSIQWGQWVEYMAKSKWLQTLKQDVIIGHPITQLLGFIIQGLVYTYCRYLFWTDLLPPVIFEILNKLKKYFNPDENSLVTWNAVDGGPNRGKSVFRKISTSWTAEGRFPELRWCRGGGGSIIRNSMWCACDLGGMHKKTLPDWSRCIHLCSHDGSHQTPSGFRCLDFGIWLQEHEGCWFTAA